MSALIQVSLKSLDWILINFGFKSCPKSNGYVWLLYIQFLKIQFRRNGCTIRGCAITPT